MTTSSGERLLPGVPGPEIARTYGAAPGDEIGTGKFDRPESSAALVANAFGFFLKRVSDAEPDVWAGTSRLVDEEAKVRHRKEVAAFARRVSGDEVRFVSCSYSRLLETWSGVGDEATRSHAKAVSERFSPGRGLGG